MADATVTAANVGYNSNPVLIHKLTSGEAIGLLEPVYLKASDSKYWRAQCDGTEEEATVKGISITATAGADQLFSVITGGHLYGLTLTEGVSYSLSANVGKISDTDPAVSTHFLTQLGGAVSATVLKVAINNTGGQVP